MTLFNHSRMKLFLGFVWLDRRIRWSFSLLCGQRLLRYWLLAFSKWQASSKSPTFIWNHFITLKHTLKKLFDAGKVGKNLMNTIARQNKSIINHMQYLKLEHIHVCVSKEYSAKSTPLTIILSTLPCCSLGHLNFIDLGA